MTAYRLTFRPLGPGGSDGKIAEPIASGDWATIAAAWETAARDRRLFDPRTLDPANYRTIPGVSSANGRRYALHVIGQGTLEVWEVSS